MHVLSFEIVQPTLEHASLILEWRNDHHTRRMSYHHDPKSPADFFADFQQTYFRHPELPAVFALAAGRRVGFLRFTPVSVPGSMRIACDISINVDPARRGEGLGSSILDAVLIFLRCRGMDDLYAEVRVENEGSRKVFAKAGFVCLGEEEKLIEDTKERCRIVRYRARLTSPFLADDHVFVIAEAGSNWRMGTSERDLAMAHALIDVAAEAGADAVKFQTYRPETVYVANAGKSNYLAQNGICKDISAIFADLAMPYDMIPKLADYCTRKNIQFMSTPFSPDDFRAIAPFVNVNKIASYEISHIRLLEMAGRDVKPLILSTGAANEEDIAWAMNTYLAAGGKELCLMQCTAKYPAPPESMNLRVIPWIKQRFGVTAGLSDHSRHPTRAPLAAVALGARVIEKHYTLDNRLPGPDHAFAVTPAELKDMVAAIRAGEQMLGTGIKDVQDEERELYGFGRRGIQALRDIDQGECLREGENIGILRPGQQTLGLHPKFLPGIDGKRAAKKITQGEGITPDAWTDAA
jgi:sialic acid synthase SpsE/L-amino acid N-acyltransferase YncA